MYNSTFRAKNNILRQMMKLILEPLLSLEVVSLHTKASPLSHVCPPAVLFWTLPRTQAVATNLVPMTLQKQLTYTLKVLALFSFFLETLDD